VTCKPPVKLLKLRRTNGNNSGCRCHHSGEKGAFNFQHWVASRPNDEFEIAAVTVAELWHGVERAAGTHKLKRQQYLQTILASLPVIPYTEQTAYEHARIWAELESSGKRIGYYDLIVAATALERGGEVATFNQRHFALVKGLTVIEPE
jgi:tRNA(fMet)-specific endonuclease VapC